MKATTPTPQATPDSSSAPAVKRVCAACDTWVPERMECRSVPGQPARPDAGCAGWIRSRRRDFWTQGYGAPATSL